MTTSATRPLLFEIGCEEIPARFLTQAQMDFGDRVKAALEEARLISLEWVALSPGEGEAGRQYKSPVQTYSTPRRLVAYVPAILERQADKVEEVTGPPIKVAVDAAGKYTRAAESFAQKNSATVAELIRINTPKGEYLAVKKTTPGRTGSDVLSEILPGVITGLSFPKSMYWTGKSGPRFVRPIRWIIALLGEGNDARVVPFEVAGVKAANFTFGHRMMGREPLTVSGFKDYLQKLYQSKVELEPEKRREWLQLVLHYLPRTKTLEVITEMTRVLLPPVEGTDPDQRLEELRARLKGLPEVYDTRVVADKDLEEWVVNSTEWPRALLGAFEEKFLKLPREILVTVMRDHQKYFAVEDAQGNLRPQFVASLNREGDPQGLIKRGHERVLTARFSDADFFWKADQKVKLAERLEKGWLERVTYQAKLGTYADKVRRMELIAQEICARLEALGKMTSGDTAHVLRAVALCKCDLTTQMVQEFTELQGIVGGLYAKAQGEPQPVADAIYDHYLPQGAEDPHPKTLPGTIVSLADKYDSVLAGFLAGLAPSGSSDPFGVRRAGNGIIRILIENEFPLNLMGSLFVTAINAWLQQGPSRQGVANLENDLVDFFRERLRFYLETAKQWRYDSVRAVLAAGWDPPIEAFHRAGDLEKIRGSDDLLAVSAAAKRIKNILTKSATGKDWSPGEVNDLLIEAGPEAELYKAYYAVAGAADLHQRLKQYRQAFECLASLRAPVDLFFDKVLVMVENKQVRENRLRLLSKISELLCSIADLSQIESLTSIPVGASTSRGSDE